MASKNNGSHDESMPNSQTVCKVTKSMLPLHCPLPEISLWNQHPRVYLPIEDSGMEKCPYCGTEFILEE